MSAWARVPPGDGVFCGGCGDLLPPDAAVCWVRIPRVARLLPRCAACAGPAPLDLPPLVVAAPPPVPRRPLPAWVPVAQIAAFDWRARAAGREPGEEG
jgi:hypothetical protein